METLILSKDEKGIETAGKILNDGGVVCIPTETVYGLAASAFDTEAIKKIFLAKGRPMDNPLIVHISSVEDIQKFDLVKEVPEKAKKLMDKFFPGPLTIIMEKSDKVPYEVTANLETVAIRCPSHKVANAIIKAANLPLAAPSANISGKPSPTTFAHVKNDMMGKVDAIVDGGQSDVGVESTVITLATDKPRLLRPGYVTKEMIEEVIGEIEIDKAVLNQISKDEKVSSPGMKYKHYAPKARVILLTGDGDKFISFVNQNKRDDVAAICYDEDKEKLEVKSITIGKSDDLVSHAYNLFDALRKIDADDSVSLVYAHTPSTEGVGMAVYNRLIRAAGFEVKDLG